MASPSQLQETVSPEGSPQPQRRATRSIINYRPIDYTTRLIPETSNPIRVKGNPLNPWFKCRGFSPGPQGATQAEIDDDLRQMRARGASRSETEVDICRMGGLPVAMKMEVDDSLHHMRADDSLPLASSEIHTKFGRSVKPKSSAKKVISTVPRASTRINAFSVSSPSTMGESPELPIKAETSTDTLNSIDMEVV